ncbi:MAG: hypothetical protein IT329_17215 [Caldilineaceae bacterium]|nr:hypothetical protein [Caldilineaceae bacterium]
MHTDKLDRFTAQARRALVMSQEEALRLKHSEITSAHLLLGLVRVGNGTAFQVLRDLQLVPSQIIQAVEHAMGRGESRPAGRPLLAQSSKHAIEYAVDEARLAGDSNIGTGHLLLGITRLDSTSEEENIAMRVLEALGLTPQRIRAQIERKAGDGPSAPNPGL